MLTRDGPQSHVQQVRALSLAMPPYSALTYRSRDLSCPRTTYGYHATLAADPVLRLSIPRRLHRLDPLYEGVMKGCWIWLA